jgi:hypothetical protein
MKYVYWDQDDNELILRNRCGKVLVAYSNAEVRSLNTEGASHYYDQGE